MYSLLPTTIALTYEHTRDLNAAAAHRRLVRLARRGADTRKAVAPARAEAELVPLPFLDATQRDAA
jgi:hypothetical protein